MANVRKVDQLKESLSAARKSSAKKSREETKARMIDGAVTLAASAPGGAAGAALDHYQGEDGEPHKLGPMPTAGLLGLGLGVAGILMPKKLRVVGAGLTGGGAGMFGYAAGRFTADRLDEMDDED